MGMLKKSGIISESTALPGTIPSANLLAVQTLERYNNHLGATDNFTQTGVSANGAANADATNHEMDLSSGDTLAGHARYETKKTWTPSTSPIVATFIINNVVTPAAANKIIFVGFKTDLSSASIDVQHEAMFFCNNNQWSTYVNDGAGFGLSDNLSAAPQDGDILTIVLKSNRVDFYLNGVRVVTKEANLPTGAMSLGAACHTDATANAVSCSVDMIDVSRYSL